MEAARIELASKTVGLSTTTSVSPVLFLDAALCRGRLGGHPVRFFWRISGDPGWSRCRTGPAPNRDGPLRLGAHVHRCRAGHSLLLSSLADLSGLAGLPGLLLFRQPVDVDPAAPRGTAAGSVGQFQHPTAGRNPRFADGSATLRPVLSAAPGGRKKRAASLCDETGVDAHGIRPSAHGRRCGLLCATELGIRPRCRCLGRRNRLGPAPQPLVLAHG